MNVTDFNTDGIGSIGRKLLLCAVLVGLLLPSVAGGAAVAQEATPTPTPADGDGVALPTNESVDVTNQTTDVWVEVENASGTVNATVWGVDAEGNESDSALGSATLNATDGPNATDLEEVPINATEWSSVRVEIADDASDNVTVDSVERVDAGVVSRLGGGGGGGNGWGLGLTGEIGTDVLVGSGVAVILLGLCAVALIEG